MNARSDRYADREWRATSHQPHQPPFRRTIRQHKQSAFRSLLRLLGI